MKIPGLPNKSYRRSDAAQIAAKKYKTSPTRIYQIWKMQGEIKQQPLRGARAHWLRPSGRIASIILLVYYFLCKTIKSSWTWDIVFRD